MKTTSYRITPVTRYNLTEGWSDPENRAGAVGSVGEFNNLAEAEKVGRALMAATPNSTFQPLEGAPESSPVLQYVIVERGFDLEAKSVYADYPEEAEQYRQQLQTHFERDYRVFEREITDPVALAHRGIEVRPTSWAPLNL